ncbi:MAG: DUF484 family protein [Pseudohongiellaceae bacterium]
MSNANNVTNVIDENKTAAQADANPAAEISAEQVAAYLHTHPDFFIAHQELLAELHLPHASGSAISLVERQISILRNRGMDARVKLNNLLDNARNNDLLFETTRDLVLALLRARDANEIVQIAQDRLNQLENIDACEFLLAQRSGLQLADNIRSEPVEKLKQDYQDVFRLKRTHCGGLKQGQINSLFSTADAKISSTALCPVTHQGEVLGLIALGNREEDYFNLNLDTLFLDFIGDVVGAVLGRELDRHK